MRKRWILIYWLLLLVPTAVIGAAAFDLLSHEQQRIAQQARDAIEDRARALAETLQLTVEAVEEELTQALERIPPEKVEQALTAWQSLNPLVRNAFVWAPRAGLVMPAPGASATAEEGRFMARYSGLFSGRIPWRVEPAGLEAGTATEPDSGRATSRSRPGGLLASAQKFKSARRDLLDMAKGQVAASKDPLPAAEAGGADAVGWMPWFAENNLYILGWVRPQPDGPVYGVELEVMTLLSRLVAGFPSPQEVPADTVYAVIDGSGRILHQAGSIGLDGDIRPQLAIALAPQLPHWQLAVFFAPGFMAADAGRSYLILSGLLLATFLTAILAGGALLTRQAYRHFKDARQKTGFVSNVSHELKTPLTSIRMYAELLGSGRVASEEKRAHYLQVIVSESQRLTRLVNNVLDFSRLEQGRKTYRPEALDPVEFAHEFIAAHRLRVQTAGLDIRERIPSELPLVKTDRDALEQALLNLVDNAVKYAAGGREITLTLVDAAPWCELQVADRGPGIPGPHQKRIFDKFHRIDDSLTAGQPGSGLGLSIARRLLRGQGGDLVYRSREGGGSCFVILLPQAGRG
jgi:signal transduction histidine kinase